MTDKLDQQVRDALQRRRRSHIVPIALIMCAVGGSVCAYLWVNFGDQVRTAVFGIPPATGSTVLARAEQPVSRADFEAFEQSTLDIFLHSITARLDAQQADLRKLADQVALSAKVETLHAAQSVVPAETAVAPVAEPVPPRPPTVAQRRKPAANTTPSGPISTGGAPLPPEH